MTGTLARLFRRAMLATLVACALAPYLGLDAYRIGIPLAYFPRVVLALVSLCAVPLLLSQGSRLQAGVAAVTIAAFVHCMGWASGAATPALSASAGPTRPTPLTLLSVNVHNKAAIIEGLLELTERESVDILSLQELRLNNREKFVQGLPEFEFFWVEPEQMPQRKSTGVFASAIAIRRTEISDRASVEIFAGITDYRTFAVHAEVQDSSLWIVGVHATKPFWTEDGVAKMILGAASKAQWHKSEAAALAAWLKARTDQPVIAAGDFNAPHYADNITRLGMRNAHTESGYGANLSFPQVLPLIGIDHVLGNDHIVFHGHQSIALAPSDHCAQLARFITTQN